MDVLTVDAARDYSVDIKDFMRVIERRSKIPEYLKQNNGDLLHEFIAGYTQDDKVDYRGLIEELRYFDYEIANSKKPGNSEDLPQNKHSTTGNSNKLSRTIFEDDYIVLDSQKVPTNVLEQIEVRLARVGRYLKRHFGSEKSLDKALRAGLSVSDKNENVSVDDLKNFVLTSCKDQIIHKHIAKKDIEAFLSAFVYNAYGATNVDSVAKMVFTEENYVAKKLSRKTRPNPPPDEVNADMLRSLSAERDSETVTSKTIFTSPVDYKKAAAVLKEIEEKVYCGGLPRGGTFQTVFRSIFDCDGDGFVSHADFEGACRKLQVKA